MRIYLADLFHVYHRSRNPDTNPYTVPLGIGFLASTLKSRMSGCDVSLFRDPDKLLKALRAASPDVMGFSICSWNSDLTRRMSDIVKTVCPGVLIAGGGPSVDDSNEEIVALFEMFPAIDYFVPNEGETGFLSLIQSIERSQHRNGAIPGVAYLDETGNLIRGTYKRPVVPGVTPGSERISPKQVRLVSSDDIEIPSPYLDGTLDEFLDAGLVPIIQTMRGCPYQCHFCVSGATEWNRMRGYDLNRVKAEIDYALARSSSKDLILTDENWGILGERDIEIARFIMQKNRNESTPTRLYYYTAKIVTPASRDIVELVASIAWIGEFNMSFQSLNPQTRQAIKRTNITMNKLAANVQWARERNIPTSSEMIYGFPYESPQTFFDGVERLIREGVTGITIYPLQLFPGIDLAAKSMRDKYAFRTFFRLADCGYGIYDDGKLIAVESEEIVVANRWSSEEDYFTVRRYGFFQQVIFVRGYFVDLYRLCSEVGISFEPIVRQLALADYARFPAIQAIMTDYRNETEAELRESREQVRQDVVEQLSCSDEKGGVKVNLVCLGRLMSSPRALKEFLAMINSYFDGFLRQHPSRDVVLTYLNEILPHRIAVLEHDAEERIIFHSQFDYPKWSARRYDDPSELLLPAPRMYEATISEELKVNLRRFNNVSRSDLQGIFDKTKSKYLVREIVPCDPHIESNMCQAAFAASSYQVREREKGLDEV